jgi:hypothetical protein
MTWMRGRRVWVGAAWGPQCWLGLPGTGAEPASAGRYHQCGARNARGDQALTSGPVERLSDRTLRALVAPFQRLEGVLGGPPPPGTLMSLWLDTDSLLPVRWSLTLSASAEHGIPAGVPDFEVWFTYLDGLDLQPPTDVSAPACIS